MSAVLLMSRLILGFRCLAAGLVRPLQVAHWIMAVSPGLFELDVPPGFHYRNDFITDAEERSLLEAIAEVAFADFEMHGIAAKRRVAFFGQSYDRKSAGPIPAFLLPVRASIAEWSGIDPDAFAMALINEYRPGSPIGWHRDAPQYGIVAGISLLSACRMKLRPYVAPSALAKTPSRAPRKTSHELTLERRSGYLIAGKARSHFEHSIPAVETLRYSITFRTLRRDRGTP
jgi:alkylated DNA repair dioxygenase AlkB